MMPPRLSVPPSSASWIRFAAVLLGLGLVAYLDERFWPLLPVSHLYYLPILLAALSFGYLGGLGAALAAIALFHVTHFAATGQSAMLNEADVLRFGLFLSVGLVTAKLRNDRKRLGELVEGLDSRNWELTRLNERLSELSQARADFVAVASHELRTPLTAVLGSTDLLAQRPHLEPERRVRLATHAHDAAARLKRTVDYLLDAGMIESGRFSLRRETIRVGDLLADCRRAFPTAEVQRITLPDPLPPVEIEADRDKLLQVLVNLVGNALKYSLPGAPVQVAVEAQPTQLSIAVSDRGYGIPPDDLPHIFDRYYRAADGRVKAVRGAGLGLSVSHDIIAAHGGHLRAQSRQNVGSTFTLVLPIDPRQEAHQPEKDLCLSLPGQPPRHHLNNLGLAEKGA
jgi:signal transduction histidine kinase